MFDPTIGRFFQEDPEGFDAGDPNLYRYVGNDPVNKVDPTGMEPVAADKYKRFAEDKAKFEALRAQADGEGKANAEALRRLESAYKYKPDIKGGLKSRVDDLMRATKERNDIIDQVTTSLPEDRWEDAANKLGLPAVQQKIADTARELRLLAGMFDSAFDDSAGEKKSFALDREVAIKSEVAGPQARSLQAMGYLEQYGSGYLVGTYQWYGSEKKMVILTPRGEPTITPGRNLGPSPPTIQYPDQKTADAFDVLYSGPLIDVNAFTGNRAIKLTANRAESDEQTFWLMFDALTILAPFPKGLGAGGRAALAADETAMLGAERAASGDAGLARLFAKTSETGTKSLPAGWGRTDKFGNVVYSTLGSAEDVALARYHESVHSFLSPKLNLLREVRADFRMAAYKHSSLLQYLEEALAETYAQLRVHGIKGLPTGIAFPVKEGYVTLKATVTEGAVATIAVGGTTYGVYYMASR
jgi:hypothetical protein